MKKLGLLSLLLVFALMLSQVAFASEVSGDGYTSKCYEYEASYGYYFTMIEITNTSDVEMYYTVSVQYFDDQGNIIGVADGLAPGVPSGESCVVKCCNDAKYETFEYSIFGSATGSTLNYSHQVDTSYNMVGDKAIIEFTNNSEVEFTSFMYKTLFFDGDKLVDQKEDILLSLSLGEKFEPGRTIYVEQKPDFADNFDNIKIYVDACAF